MLFLLGVIIILSIYFLSILGGILITAVLNHFFNGENS